MILVLTAILWLVSSLNDGSRELNRSQAVAQKRGTKTDELQVDLNNTCFKED